MQMHPWGLESVEQTHQEGPVELYWSRRFTGDEKLHWNETIARHGTFHRGAILGTSSLGLEGRILETNPALHVTFFDVSEGGLDRRREVFGPRYPGRVDTRVADLELRRVRARELRSDRQLEHHPPRHQPRVPRRSDQPGADAGRIRLPRRLRG